MRLGIFAKVRGRGLRGFKRPNLSLGQFYMLLKAKNTQKLQYYLITGPKLGGGEGSEGFSQKPKYNIIFFKPSIRELVRV